VRVLLSPPMKGPWLADSPTRGLRLRAIAGPSQSFRRRVVDSANLTDPVATALAQCVGGHGRAFPRIAFGGELGAFNDWTDLVASNCPICAAWGNRIVQTLSSAANEASDGGQGPRPARSNPHRSARRGASAAALGSAGEPRSVSRDAHCNELPRPLERASFVCALAGMALRVRRSIFADHIAGGAGVFRVGITPLWDVGVVLVPATIPLARREAHERCLASGICLFLAAAPPISAKGMR